MTVSTAMDSILSDIESHVRYGNADVDGVKSIDWQSWDNAFGKVVIGVHLRQLTPVMTADEMREAIDRVNIVVGLVSYDVAANGLLHMETLRTIAQSGSFKKSKDLDSDEIVR